MHTVLIKCTECGKEFTRSITEHTRNRNKGRKPFCSLSCSTRWGNRNIPRYRKPPPADNRRDEYTPFRYFIRVTKSRKHDNDLDLQFLKNMWNDQEGICPLTGWKMILPVHSSKFESKSPRNASIDRIDSSLGYTKDNVRFISYMANLARNDWADKEVREFARAVEDTQLMTKSK